jgi:hypothetical protein
MTAFLSQQPVKVGPSFLHSRFMTVNPRPVEASPRGGARKAGGLSLLILHCQPLIYAPQHGLSNHVFGPRSQTGLPYSSVLALSVWTMTDRDGRVVLRKPTTLSAPGAPGAPTCKQSSRGKGRQGDEMPRLHTVSAAKARLAVKLVYARNRATYGSSRAFAMAPFDWCCGNGSIQAYYLGPGS